MGAKEMRGMREAIEEMGGADRVHDEIVAYSRRVQRLDARWKQLLEEYPDKWVAVANDEIVAVGNTLDEVLRATDEQGVPRADVVVEFLDTNPISLIL